MYIVAYFLLSFLTKLRIHLDWENIVSTFWLFIQRKYLIQLHYHTYVDVDEEIVKSKMLSKSAIYKIGCGLSEPNDEL